MAFDKDKPAASTGLDDSNPELLANFSALEDVIGQDHEFSTGGANTGEHKQVKFNAPISTPTNAANKGFVYVKDFSGKLELCFLDEDGNEIQLTSAGKLLSSSLDMKDEDDMASNSATHAATQQSIKAYSDSGTQTMTNKTLTSPVLNTGVSGTAVKDEDDMASDSATHLATQQSIKAYTDAQIAAKTQSDQVTGSSDISNTTGSFANMTDMSISITTTGGDVLLLFTAVCYCGASGDQAAFEFRKTSGTAASYGDASIDGDDSDDDWTINMHYLVTGLSAGSHTFVVRWRDVVGTVYQKGTSYTRVFTAIELP